MPKNERALPDGFMTVGKLAERMGVTVRTLQYYDREGLLSPTAESGGGRRLYTDKDMIQLHQILSLKSLGFSLDDIKNRLAPLDTPADVADALAAQAAAVREKIAVLTESLTAIETLRAEVLQMQTVDFKKYADIIVNLQMKMSFTGSSSILTKERWTISAAASTKRAAGRCWRPSTACRTRRCVCRPQASRPKGRGGRRWRPHFGRW